MSKKNLGMLSLMVLLIGSSLYIQAAPIKIMPLGDSITGNPGCWKAILWNKLQQNGYTNIDFVGTQPLQGCSLPYDGDNEGHGGALVTNVADQNQLPAWLSATNPDIVMMHFGTNDVWSNRSVSIILAAYSKLVDQMRTNNSKMKILVAKIIPMNPSSCPECYQRVIDLNNAIPAWASSKTTTQSPIIVVDQWTGFNTATDTGDAVHPNAAGDQKIADKWYTPLVTFLTGTTPTPTSSVKKGDVNGDGFIDIIDALLISQYAVGLTPEKFITAAADANADGTIDIIDALVLAQCSVGLPCKIVQ